MKETVVKNKSFDFALRIIKLYQFLCNDKKEYVMSKQLLGSGTSIGAKIREADFISELSISLKKANESDY